MKAELVVLGKLENRRTLNRQIDALGTRLILADLEIEAVLYGKAKARALVVGWYSQSASDEPRRTFEANLGKPVLWFLNNPCWEWEEKDGVSEPKPVLLKALPVDRKAEAVRMCAARVAPARGVLEQTRECLLQKEYSGHPSDMGVIVNADTPSARAFLTLEESGEAALPAIVSLLRSPRLEPRAWGCRLAEGLGSMDPKLLEALGDLLDKPGQVRDDWTRIRREISELARDAMGACAKTPFKTAEEAAAWLAKRRAP